MADEVKVSGCDNERRFCSGSCSQDIIPQLLEEWQQERRERGERLDTEWKVLQGREMEIREVLMDGGTVSSEEMESLIIELRRIEHRMGEILWELQHGYPWENNGQEGGAI